MQLADYRPREGIHKASIEIRESSKELHDRLRLLSQPVSLRLQLHPEQPPGQQLASGPASVSEERNRPPRREPQSTEGDGPTG